MQAPSGDHVVRQRGSRDSNPLALLPHPAKRRRFPGLPVSMWLTRRGIWVLSRCLRAAV
jgi:hypothetical protein